MVHRKYHPLVLQLETREITFVVLLPLANDVYSLLKEVGLAGVEILAQEVIWVTKEEVSEQYLELEVTFVAA